MLAESADTISYLVLAFNILLLFSLSAEFAIRLHESYSEFQPIALKFNIYLFLVNCRSNWVARLVDFSKYGEHLPSDSSVLIFASTDLTKEWWNNRLESPRMWIWSFTTLSMIPSCSLASSPVQYPSSSLSSLLPLEVVFEISYVKFSWQCYNFPLK